MFLTIKADASIQELRRLSVFHFEPLKNKREGKREEKKEKKSLK